MSKHGWKTFEHNGVMFSPAYIPHKIPILYNNKSIILTTDQEEYATIFARYIGTDYYENKTFKKNFFADWKMLFDKNTDIKDINLCNFSKIKSYLDKKKEEKKLLSSEEKKRIKQKKDRNSEKYKYAFVDKKKQPVGNFIVEPPSIFIGRGSHPSLGSIKWRIYPSDITLNLSKDAILPEIDKTSFNTHTDQKLLKWGAVVNENKSYWLASWKDLITGKTKYVWLSDKSDIKASKDEIKFDTAKSLGKIIEKIRKTYMDNMGSKDTKIRQIATAVYFIDIFALRVGNEKGKDEADTVGTVSLRIEHIKLKEFGKIELDFLGKDSVRYINTFSVLPPVYENLQKFIKNKSSDENIFDLISTNDVNKYLKKFMKKLTARVFRTYNSSKLYQDEIIRLSKKPNSIKNYDPSRGFNYSKILYWRSSTDKTKKKDICVKTIIDILNNANIAVAMLCNHQKNIGKGSQSLKDKINKLDKEHKNYKDRVNKLKEKEKSSHLALGTSKLNYIDPRITVAFLKKNKIDPSEYYNERELTKFKWALSTNADFYI
jgi:DNA topoisomerase-1